MVAASRLLELYEEYDEGMTNGRFQSLETDERRELALYRQGKEAFIKHLRLAKEGDLSFVTIGRAKKQACVSGILGETVCLGMKGGKLPGTNAAQSEYMMALSGIRGKEKGPKKHKVQQKALWGY